MNKVEKRFFQLGIQAERNRILEQLDKLDRISKNPKALTPHEKPMKEYYGCLRLTRRAVIQRVKNFVISGKVACVKH